MNDLTATTPSAEAADLEAIVARALALAADAGATQAEAAASSSAGLGVTVRLGEVETLEQTRDRGVSVTVYLGQCKASASTVGLRR
jgi:PmbA protein